MIETIEAFLADPRLPYERLLVVALVATLVLLGLHALLARGTHRTDRPRLGWVSRILWAGLGLAVGVGGGTAFSAVLRGESLHGWLLLAHLTAAGAITFTLPLLALWWLPALRSGARPGRFGVAARLVWLGALLAGLATLAPILTMMSPFAGTAWQRTLLEVHRLGGLALVFALGLHAGLAWQDRPRA